MYNTQIIIGFLLVTGAISLADSADQSSLTEFSDTVKIYSLADEPGKLRDLANRRTRELLKYDFIPEMRREKRETEEESKADNVKGSVQPKKTIEPVKSTNHSSSEPVVTTVPTPATVSSNSAGNTSVPTATTTVSTANTTVAVSSTPAGDPVNDQLDREFPNYPVLHNTTEDKWNVQNESHIYYDTSTVADGMKYWENLDEHPLTEEHAMLSSAHRRAATMRLHFDFPFYGHLIDNATIATGGFVYLGEQAHKWLAATQYVAPLMANFDSSLSDNATIRYLSTDSQFTVEWNNVHVKDSPDLGPFSFQLSLYKNGTIAFVYKYLPIPITNVSDQHHPVKVGISDAYIRDKNILFVKQKTIYEYHRVELKNRDIKNGTAIIFTPLPTCLNFKTCSDCINHNSTFECSWCPSANRCSDGTDRYRHDWINKECDRRNTTTPEQCAAPPPNTYNVDTNSGIKSDTAHPSNSKSSRIDDVDKSHMTQHEEESGMSAGGVVSVLFLVMMIVGVAGWLFYAYLFPHSTSGQLLIRYRPSQWAFRRGEARYTAASIHM